MNARSRTLIVTLLGIAGLGAAAPALAGGLDGAVPVARHAVEAAFLKAHPGVEFYRTGSTITTISGATLAIGNSPVDSAEAFLQAGAGVIGVSRDELIEGSLAADQAHVRGLMPVRDQAGVWTGEYKFTLVSYLQIRDGVEVYGGNVRVLVANAENSPATLVRSGVRDLGNFRVNNAVVESPRIDDAIKNAQKRYPGLGDITPPRVVIFAGDDVSRPVAPVLAVVFDGTVGAVGAGDYARYRVVADAATGAVIWSESLIRHTDVSGKIQGMATDGYKSAECNAESLKGMPYARASIGATNVYANVNGDFTVPNGGTSAVTVVGSLQGQYFNVYTPSTLEPTLSTSVTPPGPATITFNSANTDQTRRAAVNAYLQANVVRDFLLAHSPGYPTIATQTNFRVNVAVSGTCNAFYDGTSINFYSSGGGCANTAYADVVHHEYGHHVVQMAGSGQGEYGEGTGDCMGVLISDQPVLGYGFQNNCAAGIRNASNTCQYSAGSCSTCGSEIHDCGQLISGCVWSLRNELLATNPSDYRTILADLVTNAVLLHDGTAINAQIYSDYVALDGGTSGAHYCQITNAFAAHGLATSTNSLSFSYSSVPSLIPPSGGVVGTVTVGALCSFTPAPNTGKLFVDAENDGTYVQYSMNQLSANVYELNFPATTCGSVVRWYVTANTTTAATVSDPAGAPTSYRTAFSGSGTALNFSDTFETNQGWVATVSGATSGQWQRGVPANGGRGDPGSDSSDAGTQCYLTQNAAGDSDVDGGSVILTSPTMNGSGGEAYLSYARWFDNSGAGTGATPWDDTFLVEISNNNGASWTQLELVGPTTEARGGWYTRTFKISNTVVPTAQMKVRFTARDLGTGSVVEAAVDAVKIEIVNCYCPADFNEDSFVNGDDFDGFMDAFALGDPAADFNNDTFVTGDDFDAFMDAFTAGC